MTYTCATEGCGEPIYFGKLSKRWRHEVSDNITCITCNLRGDYVAHPAGGTNTTPPEELPVSYHEWSRGFAGPHFICKKCGDSVTVPEGFGPPNKELCPTPPEELELEEMSQDELTLLNRVRRERDDIREQLDRALVAKFKVGDRVEIQRDYGLTSATVKTIHIYYGTDLGGFVEEYLAPLETQCDVYRMAELKDAEIAQAVSEAVTGAQEEGENFVVLRSRDWSKGEG